VRFEEQGKEVVQRRRLEEKKMKRRRLHLRLDRNYCPTPFNLGSKLNRFCSTHGMKKMKMKMSETVRFGIVVVIDDSNKW